MDPISSYNKAQKKSQLEVLELLQRELDKVLGSENAKVWHGAPVWFVGENPVAGYSINSRGICLLFWNGQNFLDADLIPVGKYFAAEKRYQRIEDVVIPELRKLIKQSKDRVWDSKSFLKKLRTQSK